MEFSIIGLIPLPQFDKNFWKYYLFYGLKKWPSIEMKCIFFNYLTFDLVQSLTIFGKKGSLSISRVEAKADSKVSIFSQFDPRFKVGCDLEMNIFKEVIMQQEKKKIEKDFREQILRIKSMFDNISLKQAQAPTKFCWMSK